MKKKVLLIFPGQPATQIQKKILINFPLSILQLAAYLNERGYQVVTFDTRVQDFSEIKDQIKDCIAVGFSCMTGLQIKYALDCAKKIRKRYKKIPFIWGGIHPTLYPEQTAKNRFVDFVVKGEGEETLFELLESIYSNYKNPRIKSVLGICFKKGRKVICNENRPFIDIEKLPMAAYHLVDTDKYSNILYAFDYQSSRGCPYRCGFCYNMAFNKRQYRSKSAEKVVSELEFLMKNFNVKKFSFNDDEFFIRFDRVEKFCDLVIKKKLKFEWNASCRLNVIRRYPDSLVKKIKKSGCKNLNFGAESGSPDILLKITKDITTDDILEGARHTIKNGIIPLMSFMGGFPGETIEQTIQTKDIISKLWKIDRRVVANGVFIFNPYPGTVLFNEAEKLGVKFPKKFEDWGNWSFKYNADHPWLTPYHRTMLRIMFYIVRLDFYLKELVFRSGFSKYFIHLVMFGMLPWRISAKIRWKYNFFSFPIEWYFWAFVMKKTFGFL